MPSLPIQQPPTTQPRTRDRDPEASIGSAWLAHAFLGVTRIASRASCRLRQRVECLPWTNAGADGPSNRAPRDAANVRDLIPTHTPALVCIFARTRTQAQAPKENKRSDPKPRPKSKSKPAPRPPVSTGLRTRMTLHHAHAHTTVGKEGSNVSIQKPRSRRQGL